MTQSITPSSGETEVPGPRVLPSTPTDQPTESVYPVIPAQASAGPVREPSVPSSVSSSVPSSGGAAGPGPSLHEAGSRETLAHGFRAPQAVTHQSAGRDVVVDEAVEEPVTETPHITDWRPLTPAEPLPDLVSTLAAVPGGLGTELDDGFVFADQQWDTDDGHWDATPIGAQLAMEQSGLGYLDDGYSSARHAAD